jgi:HPt (histidine-containing phosphotransfer) domain-containing protein
MIKLALALALTLAAGASAHAQDARADAKKLLARFSAEPTIVEVQRAAAEYARVNPDAYDSWVDSARWAYLLPRSLRGQLRRTDSDQTDVRTTTSGLSDLVSTDAQLQLELRADWDLTRIVFNRDGINASRQIERLVNQREDILTTVNKLYFARRQLQVELELEPPTSIERAVKSQLRIDALTADLDALTGGWFSKQVPASK